MNRREVGLVGFDSSGGREAAPLGMQLGLPRSSASTDALPWDNLFKTLNLCGQLAFRSELGLTWFGRGV